MEIIREGYFMRRSYFFNAMNDIVILPRCDTIYLCIDLFDDLQVSEWVRFLIYEYVLQYVPMYGLDAIEFPEILSFLFLSGFESDNLLT